MGVVEFEASNNIETSSTSCETNDVIKKSKIITVSENAVFTERLSEYSIRRFSGHREFRAEEFSFRHQLYTILALFLPTSRLFLDFKLVSRAKY